MTDRYDYDVIMRVIRGGEVDGQLVDIMRRLLVDQADVVIIAELLGGEPFWEAHPIPVELIGHEHDTQGAAELALVVCKIADWFEHVAAAVPTAGSVELPDALRRYAGDLTGADPDPVALARDIGTLSWMVRRGYEAYEDREDRLDGRQS
jgi:hypothetical protein